MKQYKHKQTGVIATLQKNGFYQLGGCGLIHSKFIENTSDWELIKEELEYDRWVVDDKYTKWIVFYGKGIHFGIDSNSDWYSFNRSINPNISPNNKYATPGQTLKMLSDYATKLGYKEGVKIKSLIHINSTAEISHNTFAIHRNSLWLSGCCIMKNGIWAEIVEDKKSEFSEAQLIELKEIINSYKTLPKMDSCKTCGHIKCLCRVSLGNFT